MVVEERNDGGSRAPDNVSAFYLISILDFQGGNFYLLGAVYSILSMGGVRGHRREDDSDWDNKKDN